MVTIPILSNGKVTLHHVRFLWDFSPQVFIVNRTKEFKDVVPDSLDDRVVRRRFIMRTLLFAGRVRTARSSTTHR